MSLMTPTPVYCNGGSHHPPAKYVFNNQEGDTLTNPYAPPLKDIFLNGTEGPVGPPVGGARLVIITPGVHA